MHLLTAQARRQQQLSPRGLELVGVAATLDPEGMGADLRGGEARGGRLADALGVRLGNEPTPTPEPVDIEEWGRY